MLRTSAFNPFITDASYSGDGKRLLCLRPPGIARLQLLLPCVRLPAKGVCTSHVQNPRYLLRVATGLAATLTALEWYREARCVYVIAGSGPGKQDAEFISKIPSRTLVVFAKMVEREESDSDSDEFSDDEFWDGGDFGEMDLVQLTEEERDDIVHVVRQDTTDNNDNGHDADDNSGDWMNLTMAICHCGSKIHNLSGQYDNMLHLSG